MTLRIPTSPLRTEALRKLRPLVDLDHRSLEMVLESGELCCANAGEKLLDLLGQDPVLVFLLQGAVQLEEGFLSKRKISVEMPEARSMLNELLPKGGKVKAMQGEAVLFLVKRAHVNAARLEYRRPLDATTKALQIRDGVQMEAGEKDWMSRLLSSPLFHRVGPGNLQKLLLSLHHKTYQAGDLIIKAGERDDYFYILKTGSARVILENKIHGEITLEPGNFFGEGALMGDTVHSASVEMVDAGEVCLIQAKQFDELLRASLLQFVTEQQLAQLLDADSHPALVIDVRYAVEYRKGHRPNSLNIPLSLLREKAEQDLSRDATYLIDWGDDKRSQVAAMLLIEHGFTVLLIPSEVSG